MNLELFITTFKEYQRFAKQLPMANSKSLFDTYDEAMYVAVQTRLILLRKYTSKGKKNNVYFENLIDEVIKAFPLEGNYLTDIRIRFIKICDQSFERILSDGTKLNLYEFIENVMYGLYLHADGDKVANLTHTNELLRFFCAKKYVEEIEVIILELFNFLQNNNVTDIIEAESTKAPVIHLGEPNVSVQDIKSSPYWANIYGRDATDEDINTLFVHCTEEERGILRLAYSFLIEFKKDCVEIDTLKKMVFESTLEEWIDFLKATSFINGIDKPVISNQVRFTQNRDVAYVRVFPHVNEVFIIEVPHISTNVYDITFIKDKRSNEWKIFAFGSPVDPYNGDN